MARNILQMLAANLPTGRLTPLRISIHIYILFLFIKIVGYAFISAFFFSILTIMGNRSCVGIYIPIENLKHAHTTGGIFEQPYDYFDDLNVNILCNSHWSHHYVHKSFHAFCQNQTGDPNHRTHRRTHPDTEAMSINVNILCNSHWSHYYVHKSFHAFCQNQTGDTNYGTHRPTHPHTEAVSMKKDISDIHNQGRKQIIIII